MPVLLALLIIGFFVLAVIFGPIASIAALNTLFGLSIPYTFKTWLAALWLAIVLNGARSASRKS